MDTGVLLQKWKRITVEIDPSFADASWANEAPPAFLYAFRPDGARLAELFAEAPSLEPALARLLTIFRRASAPTDAYFVVSNPRPLGTDGVVSATRAWLSAAARLAERFSMDLDSETLPVEVRESDPPPMSPRDVHPMQSTLYWIVVELGRSMRLSDEARLLVEPLYHLACSYELAYWVLSPLAPETHDDPLATCVALWEAGVSLRFEGHGAETKAIAYRPLTSKS